MEKITYAEMVKEFRTHEQSDPKSHLTAHIVFTEDSFEETYPLEGRTYIVSSDNKTFRLNMGGYSIFGSSVDGTDFGVRLEAYMAAERGGKDGWKVDYCHLVD